MAMKAAAFDADPKFTKAYPLLLPLEKSRGK
jgi:hypothetical protein